MADYFPLLRRLHLFITMSDDEVRELASHFVPETFAEGEYVFKQGGPADAFYIIQNGQVEVESVGLNGETKRITILIEGDYFGEMGLVRHGVRSASVKALKPLTALKLTSEEFEKYLLHNPKVKPNLEVAIQSRQYARQANFRRWLMPNEIVYLVTLRHPLFLYEMLWKPVAVILLALIVAGLIYWYELVVNFYIVPGLMAIAGAGWWWWNWIDFHNDWYVVTNQRVVDIDKVVLFYESRAEAPIGTVQSTTIKTNEIGRQFNYGDVVVNTYSGPVIFHNVPYPQATADLILEQVHRSRVQQKTAERAALKKMLRENVGLEPMPVKSVGSGGGGGSRLNDISQPQGMLGSLVSVFANFSLRVREQRGDTIVYHKHPIVLFQEVASSVIGMVLLVLAVVAYAAGAIPFVDPLIFIGIVVFVFLIMLVHFMYEYIDWKNDVYMVTGSQIVDLMRKPFGDEQRKAANLDAITNISYVRPGLIYQLFNYGTVTINAGPGGEMKFFDVYDPVMVQQDIYRRKEAQASAKAQAATKQRVDELGQYMAAFYEVLEDERTKREGNSEKK